MFSSRLPWDSPPNPLLQALAAKRAAGVEIHDLTESNPTQAGFDYSPLDLPAVLAQPEAAHYRPTPRGLSTARAAVAEYYGAHGHVIDPESIFLTASTSEAYSFIFKLLCDPGDEVLVPQPSYPLFDFLAALDSVRLIPYPLNYAEGWAINFERLQAALDARSRAIVIVNPNNPTGHFLKRAELDQLNAICAERNLALIVDEVFLDYAANGQSSTRFASGREAVMNQLDDERVGTTAGNKLAPTFTLSGLSKITATPQLKLGWIQISGSESFIHEAQARLEFIADSYLSVSTPAQLAAPILLERRGLIQQQISARIGANYDWLATQGAGRVLQREGGWYAVLEFEDGLSDDARGLGLLERENVLAHPGYFYDCKREGYLVLSLLTPTAVFQTTKTLKVFETFRV